MMTTAIVMGLGFVFGMGLTWLFFPHTALAGAIVVGLSCAGAATVLWLERDG